MKEWLTTKEGAELLGVSKQAFCTKIKKVSADIKEIPHAGKPQIRISLQSVIEMMSPAQRAEYYSDPEKIIDGQTDHLILSEAPDYQAEKAKKYLAVFKLCEGKRGDECRAIIKEWNQRHPGNTTSYQSYRRELERFNSEGIQGILGKYGKRAGKTVVNPADFEVFQSLYLKESRPSIESCWKATLGTSIKRNYGEIPENFPSAASFFRLLKKSVPERTINTLRFGYQSSKKNYDSYCDRDFSDIAAGSLWESDHMQVDTLCIEKLPKELQAQVDQMTRKMRALIDKPFRPWLTAWKDVKTGRMLSWLLHPEAPNSDHIFETFYMAVLSVGLPDAIYIDNGKDYRCLDFAGGVKHHKVSVDEIQVRSLTALLNITVHFSKPYNGQSKTIERTFRDHHAWFEKHLPGYTASKQPDRPEKTLKEVKNKQLLDYDELSGLLDIFIEEVLNSFVSKGKNLCGRSRNQAWSEEYTGSNRGITPDAMKLFCMRSSKDYSIGRNGICFNQKHNLHYWADWMIPLKQAKSSNKRMFYIRRDPKQYQYAWVFDSKTNEYVGKAVLNAWKTAAIATSDLDKRQLEQALRTQKTERNIDTAFIPDQILTPREIVENMAAGIAAKTVHVEEAKEKVIHLFAKTAMDEVLQKEAEMQKTGTYDITGFCTPEKQIKKKIFVLETDRIEYEKNNKKG